jgi:hypothetical protein
MIWKFTTHGVYTSQSLYKIINFRGILPLHVPSVWSIRIPLRVHFFLWLVANNKLLARDNLAKRQEVTFKTCLFCSDCESSNHLFSEL